MLNVYKRYRYTYLGAQAKLSRHRRSFVPETNKLTTEVIDEETTLKWLCSANIYRNRLRRMSWVSNLFDRATP
jgi:hypothetical protein